ncbi:hypothetical protein B0H19DRAFT_394723 [Mycena capillaripes]|nr:hypothetical protein B0H19DRAFT_394723 [Mycena capillaripes]
MVSLMRSSLSRYLIFEQLRFDRNKPVNSAGHARPSIPLCGIFCLSCGSNASLLPRTRLEAILVWIIAESGIPGHFLLIALLRHASCFLFFSPGTPNHLLLFYLGISSAQTYIYILNLKPLPLAGYVEDVIYTG